MAMADVTIRGAGAFGLSIAWACARRGAKVCVIDPNGPGAGASGGLVGALAPHVPENWNHKKAFQFESLIQAETFWEEIAITGGVSSGYGRTGRLQPIADEKALALAERRASTAADLWQGKAVWQIHPAEKFGQWCPHSPTGLIIHDTLTARMHPRRACAALVAALKAKDAGFATDAPDQGRVVHATGAEGLIALSAALNKPIGNGVKGQAALLDYDAGTAPQLFADAVHIIPHADGTVAIGSTSERDYDDATSTDGQLDAVIARAITAVPALKNAPVLERWAGLRPRAKSRAPMLGEHPLFPGQFIANGGFKIGFGMAPKVAEIMADLLLDGQDAIPDDFRPIVSL